MKSIIILGAGKSQIPLIKNAKLAGFQTIVIDRNKDAIGFHFADKCFFISTYEAELIIEELEENNNKFDIVGVINNSSGPPVVTKAKLCYWLGIQAYSSEIADTIIHKSKMLKFCVKNSIRVPQFKIFKKGDNLNPDSINYPVIVKPSLSIIGKSGVYLVSQSSQLLKIINDSLRYSLDGCVNIEEYIEGDDISFLSFIQNGAIEIKILVDEINYINEDGLHYGLGYAMPTKQNQLIQEKVIDLAKLLIDKFDLQKTTFSFSCRIDKYKEPVLIEIHLELGGDLVWDVLIPKSTKVNFSNYTINFFSNRNSEPFDFKIRPTALLYGKGSGLVTDRPFKLFQAKSRIELENFFFE